jgi:hypothetical protein
MIMLRRATFAVLGVLVSVLAFNFAAAQDKQAGAELADKAIPSGARIYIAPMPSGFETYLAAGIVIKKVPVVITTLEDKADFVISGISNTEKAGWAKMLFMGSDNSNDQASIKVTNRKTGVVAFAYAVHKGSSVRGTQSAAEACAKHLKEYIESKK